MFRLDPELKQPVEHGALLLVAGLIFPTTILAVVAGAMPYPRIIYEDCVGPLTILTLSALLYRSIPPDIRV